MKINPMQMMQMKEMLEQFKNAHPRLPYFFKDAAESVDEGSVIEISITTSQGRTICTNIKVTAQDIELIQKSKEL